MIQKLDEAFKKWQQVTNELIHLLDEEIPKTAREYYISKSRPLDDKILAKLARIADEMDKHIKNGTKPSMTEMVKWSNYLYHPRQN